MPPGKLPEALNQLDALADDAAFLLGHNLIAFDLPQLRAANPNLRLLAKPAIDTLRLNPLAFPKNPYHHLVKHYQDGQLLGNRKNNPLLDAEQNIMGTVRVLEAARKNGVKRVIFASTTASYGDVLESDLPVRESKELSPLSFSCYRIT